MKNNILIVFITLMMFSAFGESNTKKKKGGIDPNLIRKELLSNLPSFRSCYQSEINRKNKAFSEKVMLSFVIIKDGTVSSASVDIKSENSKSIKTCIINVLKKINFPKPIGGGKVEVNQPFNFFTRHKN